MTDFVQTMKDWRRMCKHYSDEGVKRRTSCADMCPLGHNAACGGVMEDALDSDIKDLAEEVAKWAAEHPEPVYPTWWEYLCMIGIIPDTLGDKTLGEVTLERLMHINIPQDVAEKLGLEPK